MKNLIAVVVIALFSISFIGDGNMGKAFPSVEIKTLKGEVIKTNSFVETGKPVIVSFWSTTCVPCIKELNAINAKYTEWKKETGLEVYAISTDDARFQARVPLIASKKKWQFPVLLDGSKKLFTALGVSTNPYTVVLDKTGQIVYEHNSYVDGDDEELIKVIRGLK
jgi:peroxiredoxin